jgi:hypothetical protein
MFADDLLFETKRAELDDDRAAAALRRTLAELYGSCRCAPGARAADCERHAVDPGLFRRLIWSGLGA